MARSKRLRPVAFERRISIRLDEKMGAKLTAIAERDERSVTYVVRRYLREGLLRESAVNTETENEKEAGE